MSEQPTALRLADALEDGAYLLSVERDATAAELRRLHAENAELVLALRRIAGRCDAEPMYKIARAALAKVEASK